MNSANLILCGLKGSGKTTVGKLLSLALKCSFLDTDQHIESFYASKTGLHLSTRQIYKQEGAVCFRLIERAVITQLNPISQTVISTGGGCIIDPISVDHLKQLGILIYLKTSPEILWERIASSQIPSYLDPENPQSSFYEIAKQRTPLYEQAATITVDTDLFTQEQLKDHLLERFYPNQIDTNRKK